MPQCSAFLRQPTEIIEIIVWHVVERSDLLSLGLASKLLACIIFPCHIQYHTVSAPLRHVRTWQHLLRNRALNVRRLEVTPDSTQDRRFMHQDSFGQNHFRVDEFLDHVEFDGTIDTENLDYDRWCERLLVLALRGMSNLRTFAWRRYCPPVISTAEEDDIWSALKKKEFLVDVQLSEAKMFAPNYAISPSGKYPVPSLLVGPLPETFFGLSRFELLSHAVDFDWSMDMVSVVELLISHCPNLETLNVSIYRPLDLQVPIADNLFIRGRWPKLHFLRLKGISISPSETMSIALKSFLTFHDQLSDLILYVRTPVRVAPAALPPNSLPNLSCLDANNAIVKTLTSCPCSPPRKLETLRGLHLDSDFWNNAIDYMAGIDKASLREVEVVNIQGVADLQRLAASCPNIEWLDLQHIDLETEVWDEDTSSTRVLLTAEWAEKLSHFRNLRMLSGVAFFSSDEPELKEEHREIIAALAAWFPRLETFDDGADFSHMIEIVRGVEGPTWRTTPKRRSLWTA